ncbi:cell division protein PerM [Kitasatospora sp. NPDC001225]
MTQLMGRPILEPPGVLGGRPALADLLAGVRTALVGLAAVGLPVLGLWVATPYADDGAAAVTRLAGVLWLLGHGAPLLRGPTDAPLTVTPLLLGVLAVVRLHRAAAGVAARRGPRPRWGGPAAVWAGYCAVAVGVALHCAGDGLFRSRVLLDVLVVASVAGLATAAGARSVTALDVPADSPLDLLPPPYRPVDGAPVVRAAALAAGAGLVAAGGLLVVCSAVLDAVAGGGRGMALLGSGPVAVVGLLLLALVLLPNAVLWGAAYALGPGFAVGAGTVVSPVGTALGPVPEFPLFALLPADGPGGWRLAVSVLPLLAGVVPAVLLGRAAAGRRLPGAGSGERPEPWPPAATAVAALAAALSVGAGAAVLGWLSGGALAGERLAWVGPVPWTGPAAAGWIALVAVPGALLVRYRTLGPADGGGVYARLVRQARRGALELRAGTYALVLRLSGPGVGTADEPGPEDRDPAGPEDQTARTDQAVRTDQAARADRTE